MKLLDGSKLAERLKEDRDKRGRMAADLLFDVYENERDTLSPKMVEFCEKYLVGYWDHEFSKKRKTGSPTKKKAAKTNGNAPTAPETGK